MLMGNPSSQNLSVWELRTMLRLFSCLMLSAMEFMLYESQMLMIKPGIAGRFLLTSLAPGRRNPLFSGSRVNKFYCWRGLFARPGHLIFCSKFDNIHRVIPVQINFLFVVHHFLLFVKINCGKK